MRCRSCDYALWNLPPGRCPECGEPFKPSDFDFVVGHVRFLCPHCRQVYYGDDKRGQLQPQSFKCVQCGNAVDVDDTILLPAEGVGEYESQASLLPMDRWREIGIMRALARTLGDVIVRPGALGRRINNGSRLDVALGLSVAVSAISIALGLPAQALVISMLSGKVLDISRLEEAGYMLSFVGANHGLLTVSIWGIVVTALTSSFAPRSVNCSTRAPTCMWYAQGAMVLMFVPVLGLALAPAAVVWSATSMVASSCQVRLARAAMAVLLPGVPAIALTVLWLGAMCEDIF